MIDADDGELTPAERVDDIPRILRALRSAVREALAAHKRAGNSVVIWQDERVVWVEAADIPDDLEDEDSPQT
jgi:hypothetical protein